MSDDRSIAKKIIEDAARTILIDRPGVHGSAENSFAMIAELWSLYLRHCRFVRGNDAIRPEDVAEMMTMLKKARKVYGASSNMDNDVDDVGYTALAGMLRTPDQTLGDKLENAIDRKVPRMVHKNIDDRSLSERAGLEGKPVA